MTRELTQEQIAAGWVAIPDDCMTMPKELEGIVWHDVMLANGDEYLDEDHPEFWAWDVPPMLRASRIVAYRICKPAPVDANADMLARDLPRDPKPAPPLKWPTPWQPAQNLTHVAPIGFRVWGEQ